MPSKQYSDRNIAPTVIRSRPNMSVENGAELDIHIPWGIAGGFADPEFTPSFFANFPGSSGLEFDPDSGVISGQLEADVNDSTISISYGVRNSVGNNEVVREVQESFTITVGSIVVEPPPPPEEGAPEGGLRIHEDSGNLRIEFPITPVAGTHTARQVQRRSHLYSRGPDDAWADLGSQATSDIVYTDTTNADETCYEYRVKDTVDGVDYFSKIIAGFTSASAPTITDNANDVTFTHGPFTAVVDKTSYNMTASLHGIPVISGMNFSCSVDRETTPASLNNPVPTTVTMSSEPSKPYHVDVHCQDSTQDLQLWTDLEFFPNKPLVLGFPVVRTWYTDNPNSHYSSIYDTLVIRDEDFGFESTLIQDSPGTWLQNNPLDGRKSDVLDEVRAGVVGYDHKDGGRWYECAGAEVRSVYIRGNDNLKDYVSYIWANPISVDSFVMDFDAPVNDPAYANILGAAQWEALDASGAVIASGDSDSQSSTNRGLRITDALLGVKELRIKANATPYGKRVITGTIRGIVAGETAYQLGLTKLEPSAAECYPFGFSVERLGRQSPVRVEVSSTGVKRVARSTIDYLRPMVAGIPSCGSTIAVAFSVGTGGADQAHDAPDAHTGQSAKVPYEFFPELAGQTAKTAEVWDYCEEQFFVTYEREVFLANNLGDGDCLLSAISDYSEAELKMFTSHRQGGTQNVAVNLLRRNWTQNNWDLALSSTNFSMRAMTADYGPRSKYMGALCRKAETRPFNYMAVEPQLGYQHQAIALLLMYEYTGRKVYLDHARITIDGGAYNINRDTTETNDPGFYMHGWTRTTAMMHQCAILGLTNFGDIHPVFDGKAPTNTKASPETPIQDERTYLSLIKTRMDAELGAIINGGSTLKYMGAAQYKSSQPVWATWSVAMIAWYYNRMVADGDTARAAQALLVLQDTGKKYMDDFTIGSGSSMQFAYATSPGGPASDPITVSSYTASYATPGYCSFFMEVYALAYEADFNANGVTTLNTELKAKVLEVWDNFKEDFTSGVVNHRSAAAILHGLPNCTRIFPGELV